MLPERALHLRGILEGVEPDLEDVVDEGEERREGVGRHEQRHEAVLDDCGWERGNRVISSENYFYNEVLMND